MDKWQETLTEVSERWVGDASHLLRNTDGDDDVCVMCLCCVEWGQKKVSFDENKRGLTDHSNVVLQSFSLNNN